MPTFGGPTNLPIFESFYFKKPIFYTKHLIDDDLKKCYSKIMFAIRNKILFDHNKIRMHVEKLLS